MQKTTQGTINNGASGRAGAMSDMIVYRDGELKISTKIEKDNIWLRQNEIAQLFDKDRTVVRRHINNILKDKEVDEKNNVQKMHFANSDKPVKIYSLDIILAIGYRTIMASFFEMLRAFVTFPKSISPLSYTSIGKEILIS